MHQFIHDKGCTSHIAGILHERDKGIEDQDLRQEDNDGSYTGDGTIHNHCLDGTVGQ